MDQGEAARDRCTFALPQLFPRKRRRRRAADRAGDRAFPSNADEGQARTRLPVVWTARRHEPALRKCGSARPRLPAQAPLAGTDAARRRTAEPARARGCGGERRVLARRRPHRHRLRRPHGPHLGRCHWRRDRRPARAREWGAERRVLARRRPHRHRLRRPHGPHLGRRHRRRDRRPARARGWGAERRVLARRRPHRHRLPTTARPASGTPPPAPRSPPCAGTRMGC